MERVHRENKREGNFIPFFQRVITGQRACISTERTFRIMRSIGSRELIFYDYFGLEYKTGDDAPALGSPLARKRGQDERDAEGARSSHSSAAAFIVLDQRAESAYTHIGKTLFCSCCRYCGYVFSAIRPFFLARPRCSSASRFY